MAVRLKLFLFYSAMAWASLLKPKEGIHMIELAEKASETEAIDKACKSIFHSTRAASGDE